MKFALAFVLGVCMSFPAFARTITFDDLYAIPSAGSYEISPNNLQIVYVLSTNNLNKNSIERHLWLMNSDGTDVHQLTFGPTGEWHPIWSSDGRSIFFLSDRKTNSQIWQLPFSGGEARQVTSLSTGVSDFVLSPRGNRLVLVSEVFPECKNDSCNRARSEESKKEAVQAKVYDELLFRHYRSWDDDKVSRLFIVNIADGVERPLLMNTEDVPTSVLGGTRDFAISPDGAEIVYAKNTDSQPAVRPNNDLFLLNENGQTVHLTNSPGLESTPRFSPNGRYLAYEGTARPGYETDKRDIILYNLTEKMSTNLTEGIDLSIGSFTWDEQSKYIYLSALDRGYSKVYRINISTKKPELLLGDAVYGDPNVSPDGSFLIASRTTTTEPTEIYRFDVKSRRLKRLTHVTDAAIAGVDMKRSDEFWYVGALDDSIHGFLTLPPDFDHTKKYPLILLIHGGPQYCWLGDFNYYGWNRQLVAAQGYVVAQINPHGSAGYGQKFQDYVSGNWGKGDYEDLMKGVDYLLATFPFIDSSRMAALGRSYGGFMTNWICGHTDRFRCLVTIDGTFNHVSDYGSTDELWFPEWESKGTPWTNREEYIRSSPSTYVTAFKTPTMVIHGQFDYRVDLSEGLQMFTTLRRLGVPARLIYLPDEGHYAGKLRNLRFTYEKQFEWLARWLK